MTKGQADIVIFVGVIISLLILAPVMLKISNEIFDNFSDSINGTSTTAATEVKNIQTTFVTFWDWLIAIAFLVNVLLLFVFAFLVDTHPIFSIFYLMSAIITLMFSRYVLAPVTVIFGSDTFSTEVLQLPITNFIVTRFDIILLGIIILTGIIMYGKFRSGGLQR